MTPIPSLLIEAPPISPPIVDPLASTKAEIGRLMHAAIISPRFCHHLLTDPVGTIESGYSNESFQFTAEVKDQIRQIEAGSLEDFASQILKVVEVPSLSEMVVLHC